MLQRDIGWLKTCPEIECGQAVDFNNQLKRQRRHTNYTRTRPGSGCVENCRQRGSECVNGLKNLDIRVSSNVLFRNKTEIGVLQKFLT